MCSRLRRRRGSSSGLVERGSLLSSISCLHSLTPSYFFCCRDAISVLSAPRIDYLAESLARRKAREEKVHSQELFRLPTNPDAGSHRVTAAPPPQSDPRYAASERSSNPSTPQLGNDMQQLPSLLQPPPSHHQHPHAQQQAALPQHMLSPSQNQHHQTLAYGSPQNSVASPYQPNFSPSSTGDPFNGPTPPDFFQVGGGSFLGVFPDWNAAELDPAMVRIRLVLLSPSSHDAQRLTFRLALSVPFPVLAGRRVLHRRFLREPGERSGRRRGCSERARGGRGGSLGELGRLRDRLFACLLVYDVNAALFSLPRAGFTRRGRRKRRGPEIVKLNTPSPPSFLRLPPTSMPPSSQHAPQPLFHPPT